MSLVAVADAQGLHIRARGLSRLWGWSRALEVARRDIAGAAVEPWREVHSQLGMRVAGTSVPGRFAAGWFTVAGRQGERAWIYASKKEPVLHVQTPSGRRPAFIAISYDRVDIRPDADWVP